MFYNADHCAEIFSKRPDFVIDAIDNVTAKCHLLAYCRKERIPIVCFDRIRRPHGSAAGAKSRISRTPSTIRWRARSAASAREARVSRGRATSASRRFTPTSLRRQPVELHYDGGKGFRCVCPQGDNAYFKCDNRNLILGNASFVTGAFGLVCASIAVRALVESGSA